MLALEVKQKALSLGFELVGIASASDPTITDAASRYQAWLDAGHGVSMEYLSRHSEIKFDPSKFLTGAQSVICVGLNYGVEKQPDSVQTARVSIYTRGEDYHDVMSGRLRELSDWLENEHGARSRLFVDSAPVMDRFWGWRAGLGWIAKNTMLINRKQGSYFFIGGLFTTAVLDIDQPDADHCGRCRKCVEACPTNAINEGRFIESAKCIGYHTVENRGDIPVELSPRLGRWIAGCDICQDVCPWNDPVTPSVAFEQAGNPAFAANLKELAQWTPADFKERMATVAMGRMKFTGFARNTAVAIANSGLSLSEKKAALESLEAAMKTMPEGQGRDSAIKAIEWAMAQS